MIKQQIYSKLLSRGLYLRSCEVSEAELENLISRLSPRDIGIPLIRIGGQSDGGYLVPDDLHDLRSCFSAGVGDDSSFELFLAENYGINCYLADYSVESPPLRSDKFYFLKKYIAERSSPNAVTFQSWLKMYGNSTPNPESPDSILAMDIEGGEYEILLVADQSLFRGFKYIVMELHNFERIVHRPFFDIYSLALEKLLKDFVVCHLHPNNVIEPVIRFGITLPTVLEITLVNKQCLQVVDHLPVSKLPHPLDVANSSQNPPLSLSSHWFKH